VYSKRFVGYSIDERMTAQLAVSGLRARSPDANPLAPSMSVPIGGSQFRSRAFRAVLAAAELTWSMGRVAAAGDNAAMESCFSLLQKIVLNRQRQRTRREL
jgi:transposase InsO family protein